MSRALPRIPSPTVAAASDWGAEMAVMRVRPAHDESWEAALRHTGIARGLISELPCGSRLALATCRCAA